MDDVKTQWVGRREWKTSPALWEKLRPLAREMRSEPTPAENELWQVLRNRQIIGFKFRRQHSIERFIVDFYCPRAGLIVEVDGAVHDEAEQQSRDLIREEFLLMQGFTVIRFSNDEVLSDLSTVVARISRILDGD